MTALVTGFDAFAGLAANPSQSLVEALAGADHANLVTAVLPTAYGAAEARIRDLIRTHRPAVILMFGYDEGASAIRLELAALNLDDCATPDNDGEVRCRQRIVDDAPVGYWSTLHLQQMSEIARSLGVPVEFSRDAGGFVCNHVFFIAAHTVATELPGSVCGFVHLPAVHASTRRLKSAVRLVKQWIANERLRAHRANGVGALVESPVSSLSVKRKP